MFGLEHGKVTSHDNGGCWICATTRGSFHGHHVVPRNAGGTDGPQVLICNDCHEAIHHIAKLDVTADDYSMRNDAKQRWFNQLVRSKAGFLATVISRSEDLTGQSTNKTIKLNLQLSGEDNRLLEYWSKRLKLSKTNTLLTMLQSFRGT